MLSRVPCLLLLAPDLNLLALVFAPDRERVTL